MNLFKTKLKLCQNNQDQIKIVIIASNRFNKNFRHFWRSTNNLNPNPSIHVSVNGVNKPSQIAELFMRHFQVQSLLGPSLGVLPPWVDLRPQCRAFPERRGTPPESISPTF